MTRGQTSSRTLKVLTALLVPASLLVGYGLMECAYRAYLYYVYVLSPGIAVTTIDVRAFDQIGAPGSLYGYYQPRQPITFTSYTPDGRMAQRHTVQINNYGWPSGYDYARHKPADEFRIAVVGDSMTASINNAQPWPDALQRELNADAELLQALGVLRIRVLNLGVAGASMQVMVNPLAVIARRFSADLVIVNVIADDLRRRHGDAYSEQNPNPALPVEPITAVDSPPPVTVPDLQIDGVGIDLLACEPRVLSNPACRVSPYFHVPHGVQLDEYSLGRIKAKLASPVFWSRIATSPRPLLLLEVLGRPAVVRLPAPPFLRTLLGRERPGAAPLLMSDIVQSDAKEAEDLVIAVRSIRAMHAMSADLMLIHNPTYWYLTGQIREPALQPLVVALKGDGLEIVGIVKYLPADATERDWYGWYNLPHDGHWSDAGAAVYGRAVARAVRDRMMARMTRPAGRIGSAGLPPRSD